MEASRSNDPQGEASPESKASPDPAVAAPVSRRLNRAFGPIIAGMLIDAVDLATFGPLGFFLGVPIGLAAGYWLGTCLSLERKHCLWVAMASAIYCTMPGTEFIPLGTLVGAYARFRESGREEGER